MRLNSHSARLRIRAGLLAATLLVTAGCAFIRFEKGPYVVRGVEVVYSEQEDMTFFTWRIRNDAQLDLVEFELYDGAEYRPISTQSALYPAAPYLCGEFWCFQFQTIGPYEISATQPPVRSIHEHEGLFAGSIARFQTIPITLEISPIGIDNNAAIDVGLVDFFSDGLHRQKRNYEWGFDSGVDDEPCTDPNAWSKLPDEVRPEISWIERESGSCFVLRPDRSDENGTPVRFLLKPSAETRFVVQTYRPPTYEAPIFYGILFDIEIPNEDRCEKIQSWLKGQIESAFKSRGDTQLLGIYTPLSIVDGQPLSGCEQQSDQDYPVEAMLEDARTAAAMIAPDNARTVFIYANNVDLPPSERLRQRLIQLGEGIAEQTDLEVFTWAIGSNGIIGGGNEEVPEIPIEIEGLNNVNIPVGIGWDETTGWRPIEDATFGADIRSFARRVLPFKTMLHDISTQVEIAPPTGAVPKRFKLCQTTPISYDSIGLPTSFALYQPRSASLPWPIEGTPHYFIELEEQYLLANDAFTNRRTDAVIEYCDRFCSNGFQTRGGVRELSWQATNMGVCQWLE